MSMTFSLSGVLRLYSLKKVEKILPNEALMVGELCLLLRWMNNVNPRHQEISLTKIFSTIDRYKQYDTDSVSIICR